MYLFLEINNNSIPTTSPICSFFVWYGWCFHPKNAKLSATHRQGHRLPKPFPMRVATQQTPFYGQLSKPSQTFLWGQIQPSCFSWFLIIMSHQASKQARESKSGKSFRRFHGQYCMCVSISLNYTYPPERENKPPAPEGDFKMILLLRVPKDCNHCLIFRWYYSSSRWFYNMYNYQFNYLISNRSI